MIIAMLFLIAAALRVFYLEAWLARSIPIRKDRKGWMIVEVRRRVGMQEIPGHVSEFPVPREERIRVLRLFGIALWHNEMSVALPNTACECFENIAPQDFDRQFPNWLRLRGHSA
jgi:hypothetical protein